MSYSKHPEFQNPRRSNVCAQTQNSCRNLEVEVKKKKGVKVASLLPWGSEKIKDPKPFTPQEIIREFSKKDRLVDFGIKHKTGMTKIYFQVF